ncbi:uncharacterized protein V1516DRAFT_684832 [Lipomyces oligophaga]|uniref:uncharacterized protein n=1 Tax=Lipomyces oligophaga TaxID=45792 RepID=UPI0034CE83B5
MISDRPTSTSKPDDHDPSLDPAELRIRSLGAIGTVSTDGVVSLLSQLPSADLDAVPSPTSTTTAAGLLLNARASISVDDSLGRQRQDSVTSSYTYSSSRSASTSTRSTSISTMANTCACSGVCSCSSSTPLSLPGQHKPSLASVEPLDDNLVSLLSTAYAVLINNLPSVNFLEESFRMLTYSRSSLVSLLVRQVRNAYAANYPERVIYFNLTYALDRFSRSAIATSAPASTTTTTTQDPSLSTPDLIYSPTSSSHSQRHGYFDPAVFESYVFTRHVSQPSVQPRSAHCIVSLDLLPTHSLPDFNAFVKSRITELTPGEGVMIMVYPTSNEFFTNCLIPVLDPLLLSLLSLSSISTDACIALAAHPPAVPSFDEQTCALSSIEDCEVVHSRELILELDDWAPLWMADEERWILETLNNLESASTSSPFFSDCDTALSNAHVAATFSNLFTNDWTPYSTQSGRSGSARQVIDGIYRDARTVKGRTTVGVHVLSARPAST